MTILQSTVKTIREKWNIKKRDISVTTGKTAFCFNCNSIVPFDAITFLSNTNEKGNWCKCINCQ